MSGAENPSPPLGAELPGELGDQHAIADMTCAPTSPGLSAPGGGEEICS